MPCLCSSLASAFACMGHKKIANNQSSVLVDKTLVTNNSGMFNDDNLKSKHDCFAEVDCCGDNVNTRDM